MSIAQRSINVLRRYANTKGQDKIAAGVFETTANEIERMIDRIAALEAELEAARKDGERYLWLRKGIGFSVDVPNGVNDKGKPRNVHYRFAYKTEPEYGNALDAAIDAALEATTPENRK